MTKSYNLICMAFDGDYVTEKTRFIDIESAWQHAGDMGPRWYFYPFCFVVTPGGTIADPPDGMNWVKGKRVKTVRKMFSIAVERDEAQGMDCDGFAFLLQDMYAK